MIIFITILTNDFDCQPAGALDFPLAPLGKATTLGSEEKTHEIPFQKRLPDINNELCRVEVRIKKKNQLQKFIIITILPPLRRVRSPG